jgi:septum formation protein
MFAPRAHSRLILASTSPRRRELLRRAGVAFFAWDPGADPHLPDLPSWRAAAASALTKAARGARAFPERLVLGADTVVVLEGRTLGKPRDAAEATEMLRALSGRTHQVFTAFCLAQARRGDRTIRVRWLEVARSEVRFRRLSEDEIACYVASGAPLDKAGAYGIQDSSHNLVERVRGSYYNVVGLPVRQVRHALETVRKEE